MTRSSLVLNLFVLLVVVPSSVLAGPPARGLEVDAVAGESEAEVQPISTLSGTQPVNVMNWLLDENGNLKVSLQVRDEMHRFITPAAAVQLDAQESWQSEWVDARRFNVARVCFKTINVIETYYVTSWGEDHTNEVRLDDTTSRPSYAHGVMGPRIAIRISCQDARGWNITEASMYFRAE